MKTKTIIQKIIASIFIFFIALNYVGAQSLSWATAYATSGNENGNTIFVDASNNVYTGGNSGSTGKMALVKYNASGTQQWVANYSGGGGAIRGIAQDASGYIYVTGFSNQGGSQGNDITLIKYNTAGTQQWVSTYGSTLGDYGNAVKVTGSGYIYVAGIYNNDAALLRYNSSGTLQWIQTYGGANKDEAINLTLAVGGFSEPNIFLTGYYGADALALKYNSGGTLQWAQTFNGAGSFTDLTYDIKVDRDECVYTAGASTGTSGSFDALLLKYNSAGTLQWSKTYDASGYNDGYQALDLSNPLTTNPDIYATGWTGLTATCEVNYLTRKYNASGTVQWTSTYDGPGVCNNGSEDIAAQVSVSPNTGKIFVTGLTEMSSPNLYYDITTLRYNPSTGNQEWVSSYNRANLNDKTLGYYHPMALTYDACHGTDYIYVTGESEATSGNYDIITLAYASTGNCNRIQQVSPGDDQILFGLYPNAFTDFATLRIESEKEIQNGVLKIYNLSGSLVSYTSNIHSNQIIIEKGDMTEGIYFYQLISDNEIIASGKMIIQ